MQAKRDRPFDLQCRAPLAWREERDRAAEQADGGGDVGCAPDPQARLAEPLAGARCELVRVLAELSPEEGGLLEVVAGEGVVARAVAVEPGGDALVQAGAVDLGQRGVGGVAEEDVVEAIAVVSRLGGRGRVDEAAAGE